MLRGDPRRVLIPTLPESQLPEHYEYRGGQLGKKWASCRQALQSDPAFEDRLWFHRTCLEEGKRALQRAQKLAACFGLVPADFRASEGYDAQKLQRG